MWLPKPAGYLPNYEHKTKQTNKKNSMQQCLFPQKVTKSIWFTPNCFELLKTENFLVHKSTENTSYFFKAKSSKNIDSRFSNNNSYCFVPSSKQFWAVVNIPFLSPLMEWDTIAPSGQWIKTFQCQQDCNEIRRANTLILVNTSCVHESSPYMTT